MNQHREGSRICLNLFERFLEPVKKDGIRLGVRGAWLPTGTHYGYLDEVWKPVLGRETRLLKIIKTILLVSSQLTCSTRTKSSL